MHFQLETVAHDGRLDGDVALNPSGLRIEEEQIVTSEDDPLAIDLAEADRVVFGLTGA